MWCLQTQRFCRPSSSLLSFRIARQCFLSVSQYLFAHWRTDPESRNPIGRTPCHRDYSRRLLRFEIFFRSHEKSRGILHPPVVVNGHERNALEICALPLTFPVPAARSFRQFRRGCDITPMWPVSDEKQTRSDLNEQTTRRIGLW